MRWIAAPLARPHRFFMVFVAAELILAMAIPFVAIQGYHTLLDSRAGTFIEEPTRSDPAWRALVDPTDVVGIAEVESGTVTGVALVIHHPEVRSAGTVILVPGTLELDGVALSERNPEEAVRAVGNAIRLAVARVEVLDQAGWAGLLGPRSYQLDSPDPVDNDDGSAMFSVGPVEVEASNVAAFVGRPAPGASSISVLPRRHLFWNAMIVDPPDSEVPLAGDLEALDGATAQVVNLPLTEVQPVAVIDLSATESLIHDVVAFPAGAVPGDRLQVRVLDRTGTADLEDIAAAIAARGMEVIEIGNAGAFDAGATEVIAPGAITAVEGPLRSQLDDLALSVGAASVVVDSETGEETVVTVIIGADFDLANLY